MKQKIDTPPLPSPNLGEGVGLDALRFDPRNARKHGDRNRQVVQDSLREVGAARSIVVNEDGVVLAGNATLEAARAVGISKLHVVDVDGDTLVAVRRSGLSEAEQVRLALLDNRAGELAEWDTDALMRLAAEGISLDGMWSAEEISALTAAATAMVDSPRDGGDEFDATPSEEPPVSTSGQLYQLGAHRLLCGDSTNAEDVRRLMDGERAVLFATDPPYLVDYDGTNHPHSKTNGWETRNKDASETYHDWDNSAQGDGLYDGFISVAMAEAITDHAAWYCWHASRRQAMLEAAWERAGAFVHQQIIWVKNRPVLTRSHYLWQHEPCFFGWVRPSRPPRVSEDHPTTVWAIDSILGSADRVEHPTQKPLEVFAIPMRQHTLPGELCYEPFGGSGTQIIAAEREGRRCFAMEREPRYVDVILKRWEAETGVPPTLLEG